MFELVKFNPWLIFLNLIMWLIICIIVSPALKEPYYLSSIRRKLAFCLLLLFAVFAFWGSDWFHVYDEYDTLVLNNWRLESVYHWIAANLAPDSYFFWRLIIWGSAGVFIWSTFARLGINKNLAIALFLSIWMLWFSYARVSLAMAIAFWGFALIVCARTKWKSFYVIVGVIAILSSFFFHKSSIFLIVCCFVAFFPVFTKKWLILLVIFLPVLLYYLHYNLGDILLSDIEVESNEVTSYIERGQDYLGSEKRFQGVGYLVGQLLERIPYYMLAITSLRLVVLHNVKIYPKSVVFFMRLLILIVFVASIFLLVGVMNTQFIYERFMRFSFIPACIVLAYCLENAIYPRWHNYVLCIAISGTAYQLIYMFYCSILY